MVQEGELALSLPSDSTLNNSAQNDSLTVITEPEYGLVLTAPAPQLPAPQRSNTQEGVSFILTGLFILFLIIALRFRNNFKYAVTMFHNLVETRTRQNVFDDTVKETSLIVLLNLMWCICAGITAYSVFQFYFPEQEFLTHPALGMLWGMAIAAVYSLVMWGFYSAVGWIFSDSSHAALWVKGFSASQALMTPAFFVTALIGICRPDTGFIVGIIAFTVFVLGKLIFIWKGYRIFFNQISSGVLFLCYLCSLEIVPLILCYRCAVLLGEVL